MVLVLLMVVLLDGGGVVGWFYMVIGLKHHGNTTPTPWKPAGLDVVEQAGSYACERRHERAVDRGLSGSSQSQARLRQNALQSRCCMHQPRGLPVVVAVVCCCLLLLLLLFVVVCCCCCCCLLLIDVIYCCCCACDLLLLLLMDVICCCRLTRLVVQFVE